MSDLNPAALRAGDGIAEATKREAFEAWIKSVATFEDDHGAINLRYLALHKHYVDFDVDRAWQVWQACAALAAAPAAPSVPASFPAAIWQVLLTAADREGTEYTGPWEGPNGEPMQDDADAAIAWIKARAAAPAAAPADDPDDLTHRFYEVRQDREMLAQALRAVLDNPTEEAKQHARLALGDRSHG